MLGPSMDTLGRSVLVAVEGCLCDLLGLFLNLRSLFSSHGAHFLEHDVALGTEAEFCKQETVAARIRPTVDGERNRGVASVVIAFRTTALVISPHWVAVVPAFHCETQSVFGCIARFLVELTARRKCLLEPAFDFG